MNPTKLEALAAGLAAALHVPLPEARCALRLEMARLAVASGLESLASANARLAHLGVQIRKAA